MELTLTKIILNVVDRHQGWNLASLWPAEYSWTLGTGQLRFENNLPNYDRQEMCYQRALLGVYTIRETIQRLKVCRYPSPGGKKCR